MQLNKISILLLSLAMSCDNNEKNLNNMISSKNEIQNISIIDEIDDIPLPPPRLNSNFNSLNDWLVNICKADAPKEPITNYNFGLFESEKKYIIFIVGLNKHEQNNSTFTSINYKPTNMYFLLPSRYQNLDLQQLTDILKSELKKFVSTKKFKSSFLAKANSITINISEKIW